MGRPRRLRGILFSGTSAWCPLFRIQEGKKLRLWAEDWKRTPWWFLLFCLPLSWREIFLLLHVATIQLRCVISASKSWTQASRETKSLWAPALGASLASILAWLTSSWLHLKSNAAVPFLVCPGSAFVMVVIGSFTAGAFYCLLLRRNCNISSQGREGPLLKCGRAACIVMGYLLLVVFQLPVDKRACS